MLLLCHSCQGIEIQVKTQVCWLPFGLWLIRKMNEAIVQRFFNIEVQRTQTLISQLWIYANFKAIYEFWMLVMQRHIQGRARAESRKGNNFWRTEKEILERTFLWSVYFRDGTGKEALVYFILGEMFQNSVTLSVRIHPINAKKKPVKKHLSKRKIMKVSSPEKYFKSKLQYFSNIN